MTNEPFEKIERNVRIYCTDCNDFEFEKTYRGVAGTPAEGEYDASGDFEECPACGGTIETEQLE